MTNEQLLSLMTASIYDGSESITEAMDRAEQILEEAQRRTIFNDPNRQESIPEREQRHEAERKQMVRRAVQPSRPAAVPVSDEELPF
jgi:hypothetical protein